MSLYDQDFFAWTQRQAELLRAGRLDALDLEHIAEEIEGMGRSEKRELISRLAVLLLHLLKWQFQPGLRSVSWRLSVEEQRRKLARLLDDNPSLRALLSQAVEDAYGDALLAAERETGLSRATFPTVCPYPFDEAISSAFWPD